jgi:hypothetical protein
MLIPESLGMVHFLTIGSHRVRSELLAMSPSGPFRLAVHLPNGPIVEYFDSVITALVRQTEIEDALSGYRSDVPRAAMTGTPVGSA